MHVCIYVYLCMYVRMYARTKKSLLFPERMARMHACMFVNLFVCMDIMTNVKRGEHNNRPSHYHSFGVIEFKTQFHTGVI